ncbi:hypothetical protein ABZP36_004100 [Zizania latifolia]
MLKVSATIKSLLMPNVELWPEGEVTATINGGGGLRHHAGRGGLCRSGGDDESMGNGHMATGTVLLAGQCA